LTRLVFLPIKLVYIIVSKLLYAVSIEFVVNIVLDKQSLFGFSFTYNIGQKLDDERGEIFWWRL
jgi:hypothetical protein